LVLALCRPEAGGLFTAMVTPADPLVKPLRAASLRAATVTLL
jgi:hypothetical protein